MGQAQSLKLITKEKKKTQIAKVEIGGGKTWKIVQRINDVLETSDTRFSAQQVTTGLKHKIRFEEEGMNKKRQVTIIENSDARSVEVAGKPCQAQ